MGGSSGNGKLSNILERSVGDRLGRVGVASQTSLVVAAHGLASGAGCAIGLAAQESAVARAYGFPLVLLLIVAVVTRGFRRFSRASALAAVGTCASVWIMTYALLATIDVQLVVIAAFVQGMFVLWVLVD